MVGSGVGINGMVIGSVVNSGRSEVNTTILGTGRSAMGTGRGTVGMKHNEYE